MVYLGGVSAVHNTDTDRKKTDRYADRQPLALIPFLPVLVIHRQKAEDREVKGQSRPGGRISC